MFWGLILKSNKKYTQVLEKSFHLSSAALDHLTSDNEPVQVMYTHDDNSYLLCTLQKGKVYQCKLDLNFQEGDKLCFSTKGNGIVHLTGFLIQEDDFGFEDEDDEDMGSENEEEMEDLRKKLEAGKKQKPTKEAKASKKKALAAVEEEDSDEKEDDSDDELNETAEQESGDEEDDDDDEEGEDSDDEEDESDDEAPAPPAKQQKLDPSAQQNGKKQKQKNGLENGDKKPAQQPKQEQKQKEKGGEGKIQKLQGGLTFQDLKVGNGAEAKTGKKIQVYYEGRLKSNNKVFDATKNGPGFKMTLGRGEVIKGWEIGLSGMKVGGKRRLVIPPQLAYGAKGNPPVIPQNSTLVFDVELKNVL